MGFLLTKLAYDSPRALLDLLPELSGISGDEEEDKRGLEIFAADALGNWGKKDPAAAVAWIRSHGAGFSGSLDEGVKQRILTGAASRDPGMAFGLLGEMEIKDRQKAIASIVRGANGAEGRTAALAALRAHLASGDGGGNKEILNAGIGQLAGKSFREGFGPASNWLENAGLGPGEMTTAGSRLEYYHTIGETGQWLGWLGQSLPPDKAGEPVSRIMKRWTEVDYRAAGEWLAAAPEGPARSASIRTYAGMISTHEPETAVKWAMLLPAGEERDDTLKQIHQNWPKDQTPARDAFARQHGLR
ncbi:MAG: hypothetical protein EOP88_26335 [Verrucomicrobiaceae bacterium]|nr:MAG: hypothetical protein EOP88_26335 [Verrucomicrobiaceae bacterium]